MPSPAYINLSGFIKGITSAQAALNIATQGQTWDNPKEFVQDRFGGRTGWAYDFDASSSITITGETSGNVADVGGFTFATALTLANVDAATFGVTGGAYGDSITIDKDRGAFQSATINATAIGGIS